MLKNAYILAKIGADTAENERHFAEILPNCAADGSVEVRSSSVRKVKRSFMSQDWRSSSSHWDLAGPPS